MTMSTGSTPSGLFGVLRSPRSVVFGRGQRHVLGQVAASLGTRALICTDARLGADPEFSRLLDTLRGAGVEVFSYAEALPDVPTDLVAAAAERVRAVGANLVIGVGGGSCLDLAKTAALVATHGGKIADYYGENAVPGPTLPVVAVPTTAGTGSEATPVAVLSDPERTLKVGVSSPYLVPHTAICDPELAVGAPPALIASAGIDALSHGIESYTAIRREPTADISNERVFVGKNALTDHYALLAVSSIAANLRRAYADNGDIEAIEALLLGALAGGYALGSAGTAAAHALQYPVGALTHTPHGLGIGVLLPYVMDYNRSACVSEYAAIAAAMGLPSAHDPDADADAAIDAVTRLCADVGIPRTLADIDLSEDRLDWCAEQAMTAARLVQNNPRPLDPAELTTIAEAAYHGRSGSSAIRQSS